MMQSLKSRGYVREQFSWQWFYWYLTNEGIEYLREYLNIPSEVVPSTLKKQSRPQSRLPPGMGGRRDRDGKKMDGAPNEFKPQFRGGVGRDRGGYGGDRG